MKIAFAEQDCEVLHDSCGGQGRYVIRNLSPDALYQMPASIRQLAEITFDPGCIVGPHQHRNETVVFYFTSGHGRINDDGNIVEVGPGDVIITDCASHAIETVGDEPLVCMTVIVRHAEKA